MRGYIWFRLNDPISSSTLQKGHTSGGRSGGSSDSVSASTSASESSSTKFFVPQSTLTFVVCGHFSG